jgi:cytochrome P450
MLTFPSQVSCCELQCRLEFEVLILLGGPRICIGWRYGMLFMKTVLANVLRNYELSTDIKYDEMIYELILSLRIVQKTMIRVRRRHFD